MEHEGNQNGGKYTINGWYGYRFTLSPFLSISDYIFIYIYLRCHMLINHQTQMRGMMERYRERNM